MDDEIVSTLIKNKAKLYSEQIKKLNRTLETSREMVKVRNTQITELKAQIDILMRVIKES